MLAGTRTCRLRSSAIATAALTAAVADSNRALRSSSIAGISIPPWTETAEAMSAWARANSEEVRFASCFPALSGVGKVDQQERDDVRIRARLGTQIGIIELGTVTTGGGGSVVVALRSFRLRTHW
jgi:hypothetical protein